MFMFLMLLFQFDCTNTLNDQVLENVTVQMETGDGFEVVRYVPAISLPYDKPSPTYTVVSMPEDPTLGMYTCTSSSPYVIYLEMLSIIVILIYHGFVLLNDESIHLL